MTTDADKPDLNTDDIYFLGRGLVYRVVCAPKKLTNDEISDFVSRKDPPGTSFNRWVVTPDDLALAHTQWQEINPGNTARTQCPDCDNRHHVLMNC